MSRRNGIETCGKALDFWQAPDGAGQPLVCIATTYTFDATFFETECVGRFLQMDSHPSESESVAYLVEREEKLAGARVHALVDRRHARDKESLRWDVIGILVPSAVQHAKLGFLCWANHVRVIIGSGNLTEPGYRKNLEVFGTLDLSRTDGGSKRSLSAVIGFLEELSGFAVGQSEPNTPIARFRESLELVRQHVRGWPNSEGEDDGNPVFNTPRRSALKQLRELWPSGGPAREAYVVSPFFDHPPNDVRAAEALKTLLAQRGRRDTYFYVKTEPMPDGRMRVYAPRGLMDSLTDGGGVEVSPLSLEQKGEIRDVHGKLLILDSDSWRMFMMGSSNFTSAGLGLARGKGNLEANLVFTVKRSDPAFRQLDETWPDFEEKPLDMDSSKLIWEPAFEEVDAGGCDLPLPAGFREALFLPEKPSRVQLTLGEHLPAAWSIQVPSGRVLLESNKTGAGTHRIEWAGDPPFVLEVRWRQTDTEAVASWPVNVADPSALPPPEVLRSLSLEDLLDILGSTRPLPEATRDAIRKREKGSGGDPTLDPLKRFDSQALLLRRTKRVARALDRLRERLERPALTKDAFEWRLRGAVGPLALADAFVREARLPGEGQFCLAELALTLRRVRPDMPAHGGLPASVAQTCLDDTIREVQSRAARLTGSGSGKLLEQYVNAAFDEAVR